MEFHSDARFLISVSGVKPLWKVGFARTKSCENEALSARQIFGAALQRWSAGTDLSASADHERERYVTQPRPKTLEDLTLRFPIIPGAKSWFTALPRQPCLHRMKPLNSNGSLALISHQFQVHLEESTTVRVRRKLRSF